MIIPKLYAIAGAAVLALAAIGTIAYQHRVIESLELDVATLEAEVKDKDGLIDAQNDGIAEMIRTATAAETAMKTAGDTIETLNADLARERSKRHAATETDHALPACRALLETDLSSVCPAYARGVRDASAIH